MKVPQVSVTTLEGTLVEERIKQMVHSTLARFSLIKSGEEVNVHAEGL